MPVSALGSGQPDPAGPGEPLEDDSAPPAGRAGENEIGAGELPGDPPRTESVPVDGEQSAELGDPEEVVGAESVSPGLHALVGLAVEAAFVVVGAHGEQGRSERQPPLYMTPIYAETLAELGDPLPRELR